MKKRSKPVYWWVVRGIEGDLLMRTISRTKELAEEQTETELDTIVRVRVEEVEEKEV